MSSRLTDGAFEGAGVGAVGGSVPRQGWGLGAVLPADTSALPEKEP